MKPRKQPSLDELFRLYPQLRVTTVAEPMRESSQMPPAFLRNGTGQAEQVAASSHHHGEQN
jgi:hypothetical protein